MRVPLSWLGEFVELPADVTPEQVHADLVRVGFEEESIRRFEATGPIVVGEVLSCEPEPQTNGKTINWCQVRVAPEGQRAADGGEDVRGIVCGAHNFTVGDKVVVTLPGAVLPGDFVIAARKTYGHVSDGMIASARELALGEDHDGIIVLSRLGLDPEIGANALEVLGMNDTAVEINVTPDRGYAFSVRGVARELAHSTGAKFTDPAFAVTPKTASGYRVVIDDQAPVRGKSGATGFIARVVRGIDATRPTPAWMVARLQLAGMRSLSLAVDITNYVMLELGNPLHCYDLDRLDGGITVRRARAGEHFVSLDGQERTLDAEDLVIADDSQVLGLAGVMGGESTKSTDDTVNVLVEAATFDPITIARAARRHKLHSEASRRYERGVDPLVAAAAAQRAVDLLVEYGGGAEDVLGADIVAPWQPVPVQLPLSLVNGLLGTDITDDEARSAIKVVGCEIVSESDVGSEDGGAGAAAATGAHAAGGSANVLTVTAPSWRSDLTRPADLVEEVARIVGYDRIPSVLPVAPAGRGFTRLQQLRRRVADRITAAGFDEVQSYPFVSQTQLDAFGAGAGAGAGGAGAGAGAAGAGAAGAGVASAPESSQTGAVAAIRLANPLDGEAQFLRRSLLPGLVTAAQRNLSRGLTDLSLVELGAVFVPMSEGRGRGGAQSGSRQLGTDTVPPLAELPSDEVLAELNASIPEQPLRVAGLMLGDATQKQPGLAARAVDWADALDAAKLVAAAVTSDLIVRQGTHRAYHPGRTAELCIANASGGLVVVGVAGELLPETVAEFHLSGRVAAFELDLGVMIEEAPREPQVGQLSTYPAATQDLTLLVDVAVPAAEVLTVVTEGAGALLEHARIVDDYRGQGIPEGQRALTFALRFRAADRTLKAEEASEAKLAGVAAAAEAFGAKLRE